MRPSRLIAGIALVFVVVGGMQLGLIGASVKLGEPERAPASSEQQGLATYADFVCDGIHYSSFISGAGPEGVARWSTNAPQPGIGIKKVVNAALASVRSGYRGHAWRLKAIGMRPVGDGAWVFWVRFLDDRKSGKAGTISEAAAFVDLDGNIIKPTVDVSRRHPEPSKRSSVPEKPDCYRMKVTAEYLGYYGELVVLRDDVERTPRWPLSDGPLPLTPRKAIDLAERALLREIPQCDDTELCEGFELRTFQLRPMGTRDNWFYLVSFVLHMGGPADQIVTVAVLMDGRTVLPRRVPPDSPPPPPPWKR